VNNYGEKQDMHKVALPEVVFDWNDRSK